MSSASTNERSLRSVFGRFQWSRGSSVTPFASFVPVGNIPYDASEERLKDIFSEAGPVLSFKLVYDRESGKPKGYGFCEYRDAETASSAMRNLNGYELSGRNLRVDTATNERFREEIKNLQMPPSGGSFETPFGAEVDPEKAPDTIAKVVASLPPEQMFEIARQMKHCVLTNPNEARSMLLQNPQLAYALLQALVVMRAVDINTASSILYKLNPAPVVIPPANIGPVPGMAAHPMQPPQPSQAPPPPQPMMGAMHPGVFDPHVDAFNRPPAMAPAPQPVPAATAGFDPRIIDPRLRQSDLFAPMDPRIRAQGIDPRQQPQPIRGPAPGGPQPVSGGSAAMPPRMGNPMFTQPGPVPYSGGGPAPVRVPNPGPPTIDSSQGAAAQSDDEKKKLILQVLALTDEQVAMLPADQRHSIMVLKEQLARSGGQS